MTSLHRVAARTLSTAISGSRVVANERVVWDRQDKTARNVLFREYTLGFTRAYIEYYDWFYRGVIVSPPHDALRLELTMLDSEVLEYIPWIAEAALSRKLPRHKGIDLRDRRYAWTFAASRRHFHKLELVR